MGQLGRHDHFTFKSSLSHVGVWSKMFPLLSSPLLSFPLFFYKRTELRGRKIQNKLSGHKCKSKMQDPKYRICKGQTSRLWFLFSLLPSLTGGAGRGREGKGMGDGESGNLYGACAVFTLGLPPLSPSSAPETLTVPLGWVRGTWFHSIPQVHRKTKEN